MPAGQRRRPPASTTTPKRSSLRAHRGQPAAEAEHERPGQVEHEDQRRVEAVGHVHRGSDQACPIGAARATVSELRRDHEPVDAILAGLDGIMPGARGPLPRHPRSIPSCRCRSSAPPAGGASGCEAAGYEVTTGVGGTGVVGAAAQRRRADGDAARRHGRAAGQGGDRAAVRQHGDGDRRRRQRGAGDARLRARHARHLAGRRDRAARRRAATPGSGTCWRSSSPPRRPRRAPRR